VRILIHDARLVAPMDDARRRLPGGFVIVDGEQIEAVGTGDPPPGRVDRRIDARGKVVLPGLVNTHHHLPQTLTRNVPRVQEAPLFRWLVELYEVWRGNAPNSTRPRTRARVLVRVRALKKGSPISGLPSAIAASGTDRANRAPCPTTGGGCGA